MLPNGMEGVYPGDMDNVPERMEEERAYTTNLIATACGRYWSAEIDLLARLLRGICQRFEDGDVKYIQSLSA